jgi:hypothetical protein
VTAPPVLELTGLDGANPLGFLAALGALVSLHEARDGHPRLGWRSGHRWVPVLEGTGAPDDEGLTRVVAAALEGAAISEEAEARRVGTQRAMENAKTAVRKKRDEIRRRGLRGAERTEADERELRPLERDLEEKRREWLAALREAVPRPELALGKRIDCTAVEYREHARALADQARLPTRGALDLLAAFGNDACRRPRSDSIQPTPFCFTTGAGHQFFLETARELVARVTADGVGRTLFRSWDYRDEGLSMRWDPIEDRRYALMDRDPTASDNRPRTMWMANLLAYRALALFPTAAVGQRLATAGWDGRGRTFTWPLWEHPLGVDGVRSLVQLRELIEERPDPARLRALGVVAAYRAERVEAGEGGNRRVNFSPARRVA